MLLELQGISKRYSRPDGTRVALAGVSLQLARGQMLGVYGPSGAGKTTLLRIAAGLLRADGGSVLYDGSPLERMPGSERRRLRRREIACVWAEQPRSRLVVLDHVALPLLLDRRDRRGARRRAREALAACAARHCEQLELHELSDGERQRVAIARALAIEPRLLLADGPAANLSLPEQHAVMALLSSLAREARAAVLVADGDASALIGADPILYLRDGALVGAPAAAGGAVYPFPQPSRRAAADG